MPVHVLYFAGARDAAGTSRETLAEVPATVADLRRVLAAAHPALARILPRCRISVDQAFADDGDAVRDGAEVALIPPVAGGAPVFKVVDRPLTLTEVVDAVSGPGLGGIVTFTGTVRDATRGRRVLRLEYEAYPAMAERTLAAIGEAVGREHGVQVAIVHRVGVLAPGEAAVVIACAAPHRTPAFRACEACIERLKQDVPIWKREVYEDGSEWVGLGP
ncbi:molybdopterin converting factor, subunit 1 [Anaeromyxobacter dehalogenans 2CP-1]|uniref:Molybdopterin synthase catalytic subunit n=1 Tax=Anaeromyxobacter dehalogenans (strain ATCC BAA-258 / DSM 21875 / 2CP-1) TaxID=455488 RepID=B8JGC1_ANAD2|nr:molybdenum cofactor biosynthesis protein MoaE [Anaeromyxobacter dehalogenans]ACL64592.1 molybdopterin converting factor, subunit 1 [Anaeromyxobacter dehalogenans 2CP-1]